MKTLILLSVSKWWINLAKQPPHKIFQVFVFWKVGQVQTLVSPTAAERFVGSTLRLCFTTPWNVPRVCVCVCACTHMCMHVCAFVWGRPTWVHSLVAFYLHFETGYLKIPSLKFTLWLSGWLAKELHGSTCFRAPPPHPSTGVAYMCPQLWLLLEIHTWVLRTMLQTLKKPSLFR